MGRGRRKPRIFKRQDCGRGRATQAGMILMVTPAARAPECARAIKEATGETTHVAATLQQAAMQLREGEFSAVVVDQALMEAEPEESETVLQHMGTAIPVPVNFAITGIERVVRELRAALRRRKHETRLARQEIEQALRNELKGTVTALLLSCDLAMAARELPEAQAKIRAVHGLAQDLRAKLGIDQ